MDCVLAMAKPKEVPLLVAEILVVKDVGRNAHYSEPHFDAAGFAIGERIPFHQHGVMRSAMALAMNDFVNARFRNDFASSEHRAMLPALAWGMLAALSALSGQATAK